MRGNRGFTLVELLTGVAISSIIMLAVAAAVIGISGAYANESQTRSATEGGRTALAFIERHVKLAGYGIDPRYAFDTSPPPGVSTGKDNYALPSAPDFITDDLAFRYRDPSFVRRGTAAASTGAFVVATNFRRQYPVGTAFMIACPGGGQRAWFRSTAVNNATTVNLAPYGTANNAPPATALDCIGQQGELAPYLFVIREFRFRLFADSVDGATRGYLGFVPNLATDVSSFPATGEVLTADVEEFQVSYQMNRPQPGSPFFSTATPVDASSGNWVMLDAAGETALPNASVTAPTFDDAYDSVNRFNAHPGNIRGVRISFSVRSARKRQGNTSAFVRGDMENRGSGAVVGDGYYRAWITSAVRTPNMASRFFFLPPLLTGGTTNGNHDGA